MDFMIDYHAHLAALPTEDNGCWMSPRMRNGRKLKIFAAIHKLPLHDPREANRIYLAALKTQLEASTRVDRAVLLALDGIYDSEGRLDRGQTNFLISNDYLFS